MKYKSFLKVFFLVGILLLAGTAVYATTTLSGLGSSASTGTTTAASALTLGQIQLQLNQIASQIQTLNSSGFHPVNSSGAVTNLAGVPVTKPTTSSSGSSSGGSAGTSSSSSSNNASTNPSVSGNNSSVPGSSGSGSATNQYGNPTNPLNPTSPVIPGSTESSTNGSVNPLNPLNNGSTGPTSKCLDFKTLQKCSNSINCTTTICANGCACASSNNCTCKSAPTNSNAGSAGTSSGSSSGSPKCQQSFDNWCKVGMVVAGGADRVPYCGHGITANGEVWTPCPYHAEQFRPGCEINPSEGESPADSCYRRCGAAYIPTLSCDKLKNWGGSENGCSCAVGLVVDACEICGGDTGVNYSDAYSPSSSSSAGVKKPTGAPTTSSSTGYTNQCYDSSTLTLVTSGGNSIKSCTDGSCKIIPCMYGCSCTSDTSCSCYVPPQPATTPTTSSGSTGTNNSAGSSSGSSAGSSSGSSSGTGSSSSLCFCTYVNGMVGLRCPGSVPEIKWCAQNSWCKDNEYSNIPGHQTLLSPAQCMPLGSSTSGSSGSTSSSGGSSSASSSSGSGVSTGSGLINMGTMTNGSYALTDQQSSQFQQSIDNIKNLIQQLLNK